MEMEAAPRHIAPAVDRRRAALAALPFPHFPFRFHLPSRFVCFALVFRFCFLLLVHQLYLCVRFLLLFAIAANPPRSVDLCQQHALLLQFRLLRAQLLIRVQLLRPVLQLLLLLPSHDCALFAFEERPIIAAIDEDTCRSEGSSEWCHLPRFHLLRQVSSSQEMLAMTSMKVYLSAPSYKLLEVSAGGFRVQLVLVHSFRLVDSLMISPLWFACFVGLSILLAIECIGRLARRAHGSAIIRLKQLIVGPKQLSSWS